MKTFCTTQRFSGYRNIKIFLLKEPKCSTFADLFSSDKQLSELCHFADNFEKLNTSSAPSI